SLGTGTRLTLRVRGTSAMVEEVLGASERVTNYELIEDEDALVARVVLKADDREALIAELVRADIGIRLVEETMSELEQIFLELTRAASNPTTRQQMAEAGGRSVRREVRA